MSYSNSIVNNYVLCPRNFNAAGGVQNLSEEDQVRAKEISDRLVSEGVLDAPFKTTWPLLAMKRAIRYAAENGFDSIAWTTGEQQAERYDLSKQVEHITWNRMAADGTYELFVYPKEGTQIERSGLDESGIADFVGKEIAEKIVKSDDENGKLSGLDLKVGGEGMAVFYDKMLPSAVRKYVKKWGGRVANKSLAVPAKAVRMPHGWVRARVRHE